MNAKLSVSPLARYHFVLSTWPQNVPETWRIIRITQRNQLMWTTITLFNSTDTSTLWKPSQQVLVVLHSLHSFSILFGCKWLSQQQLGIVVIASNQFSCPQIGQDKPSTLTRLQNRPLFCPERTRHYSTSQKRNPPPRNPAGAKLVRIQGLMPASISHFSLGF